MTTRPFKVLGIQQVAVGAVDKSALRKLWVDTLGLIPHGSYKSEKENVDEDIVTMGAGAFTVEVDLMQPLDPDARPKVHDPSLNHVGLWVDDLAAADARMAADICAPVEPQLAWLRDHGYVEVEPFNDEPYGTHWLSKRLQGGAP